MGGLCSRRSRHARDSVPKPLSEAAPMRGPKPSFSAGRRSRPSPEAGDGDGDGDGEVSKLEPSSAPALVGSFRSQLSAPSTMGIPGAIAVQESHMWDSQRMPRSRLRNPNSNRSQFSTGSPGSARNSRLVAPDKDAIQQAIASHAASTGGPPLMLAHKQPQSMGVIERGLQRDRHLGSGLRTVQTWNAIQRVHDMEASDELESFCDSMENTPQTK